MIFSRSWFALMRRNTIYRKRYLSSTFFEFALPFCFVWILVAVKNSVGKEDAKVQPEFLPDDQHVLVPFSFEDYMTALRAQRVCYRLQANPYSITGMNEGNFNWLVPFVRCDARMCEYLGQDAQPFCEYSMLAVSASSAGDDGGQRRAEEFKNYVYDRWPFLLQIRTGREVEGRPFPFEFVQVFRDPNAMNEYVRRADYGSVDVPKIGMGVVFDGDDPNHFKYWLRQNSTNMNVPESEEERWPMVTTTPPTNLIFNDFARTDLETCFRQPGGPGYGDFQDSCTGQYLYNGVIATQRLVGDFILNQTGADAAGYFVADGGVGFVQFPMESFIDDGFFQQFEDIIPILFSLGFLYPFASMIGYVVREKEHRQKEFMKIMSVTESDIGWAWFSTFFLLHLLASTVTAVISTILYEDSNFFTLWLFWQLTILAVIVFAMALSAITSKTSRAVLIGVLFFLMGTLLTIAIDFRTTSSTVVGLISLHPVTAFTYGVRSIGRLEDIGLGITSDTIDFTESNIRYSIMTTMRWLGIDILLWGFLSYYLNRVIPQDYGQNLPPWFPLMPSYWFPSMRRPNKENVDARREANGTGAVIEEVGAALKKQTDLGQTIEIENLRKTFGDKIAIDDLSLSMYNGQITALLGHNGAGKTTTINVLTGATPPTSGHATVVGKDVLYDVLEIRKDIGICFQHDCLFDKLTVREHIEFFARLKGLYVNESRREAERQIDQAILDVALSEKSSTLSCNLSGGMKRKLSVAIAFCGGSKVVLLDEPTSGMDPFSRRFTWDVIRSYRQDRVIILTTHFMDEADILGDRIAIMAKGQLRCVGSSLWLKKQYSVGYQLTIERNVSKLPTTKALEAGDSQSDSDDDSITFDSAELKRIVTKAVPKAKIITNVGAELSYRLPINESPKFPSMFENLDKQIDRGHISSYGVSITTLNAVFLAVTRGETAASLTEKRGSSRRHGSSRKMVSFEKGGPLRGSARSLASSGELNSSGKNSLNVGTADSDETSSTPPGSPESQNRGITAPSKALDASVFNSGNKEAVINLENDALFLRHMGSLLKKRALYFRRDKKAWICTTIVPSVFVLIGLVIFVLVAADRNLAPLKLDIEDYNPVLGNTISFNSPDNPFLCQPGICSYGVPYVQNRLTDELYAWCGFESRLGISQNAKSGEFEYEPSEQTCSISQSRNIVNTTSLDRGMLEEAGVRNITEASLYLHAFRDSYANSKYGAIWFTHDQFSMMNGTLYNETVVQQCKLANTAITYPRDCRRFGGVGYVIQFNFTAPHAALMYESIANEALVRHGSDKPDFKIETTIAPLPITAVENNLGAGEDAFTVWFLIVFGFPFIAGAYASFVVTERKIGAKHLQTVAGVETSSYWFSTFFWDVLNYQIPLWVTIGLMYLFRVDVLITSERDTFSSVIALLFLFGPASAGFAYCVSFAFRSASMANICLIITQFLVGMGGPLVCFVLVLLARDPKNPRPNLETIADILEWVLRFMPSFCLGNGLFAVINIDLIAFLENDENLSAWSGHVMLYDIYFLAAECVLYVFLAMQFDIWSTNPHVMSMVHKVLNCLTCNTSYDKQYVSLPDDDDVIAEEEAVMAAGDSDREDLIVIQQLTKFYDTGKLAVDRLSLGIAPGECFGLLGINGAGKTTTMKMLTAEFPPTSGDAILDGFSVSRQPQKTRRRIGYCPQFDAHFAHLTGREHVELYASIKGIPAHLVSEAAEEKLREVGLSVFDSNRLAAGYSGGMKRRLSLACATVGRPQIIFLDECSTGVDPVAREDIWMMVSEMVAGHGLPQSKKPSVILTTHSMEECEALCPRIGIMANGRLRCLGSAQRLKSKFGQGFQVEVKVHFVDCDDEDFVGNAQSLKGYRDGESKEFFNLQECVDALDRLSGNTLLSAMVSENSSGPGYAVWKEASSPVGVSLDELTAYATAELRMLKLETFVSDTFPTYVLRERQDTKARYEVSGDGVRISKIFASIEEHKEELKLTDYSVSQTSLEQVFNMHAEEAEKHKHGRVERWA